MNKPSIGDIVYLLAINNKAQRGQPLPEEPIEKEVSMVGRKYFNVIDVGSDPEFAFAHKFNLDNLLESSNYSANYRLFLTKQDYYDYVDRERLESLIQSNLNGVSMYHANLPLELLKDIEQVLLKHNIIRNEE